MKKNRHHGRAKFPPAMHSRHYHIIDYAIIIASCDGGVGGRQHVADEGRRQPKRGRLKNAKGSQKQRPTHHFIAALTSLVLAAAKR